METKDELVMITDMDMLPMSSNYYCDGLQDFNTEDFIYYIHNSFLLFYNIIIYIIVNWTYT